MRIKLVAVAIALTALGGVVGCGTTPVQNGAIQGGVLGAGAGAIIGNQSGKTAEGAIIGGAAGAIGGALIGDQSQQGGGSK